MCTRVHACTRPSCIFYNVFFIQNKYILPSVPVLHVIFLLYIHTYPGTCVLHTHHVQVKYSECPGPSVPWSSEGVTCIPVTYLFYCVSLTLNPFFPRKSVNTLSTVSLIEAIHNIASKNCLIPISLS